ncbi:hypothetical protein SAMN02744133_108122 [Thalassospira xiamenensis M-5 = DSM 17429]|uniref:Phage integrase family protein n=1 Tax=Thalassospira xiamenensis M-5 = DSM 17429 TaxID=1123366 RepID=A0AB72ULI7_9PROT|nr:site-specific integrase [Thalassospira xiamenensis]AJD54396.1 hypothetical protein TH3_21618 [Thalassospira xiamenensis M-5 = DSM 17429]SIT21886.1 hypothetical protein SAMN02744133_108122 [Thalassospira xiamenensis M-5 = DSM 17429]
MILDGSIWNGVLPRSVTSSNFESADLTAETIDLYAKSIRDLTAEYRDLLDASAGPLDLIPDVSPDWAFPPMETGLRHSPTMFVPGTWEPLPRQKGPLTLFSLWMAYSKLPSVQRSSRRVYRSALMMGVQTIPGIDAATSLMILASTRYLYEDCANPTGTWKKLKGIPQEDSVQLFSYLEGLPSASARNTSLWLRAGMLVGLRPLEWRDVSHVHGSDGKPEHLRIKNAKHTHGRAPGRYRECDISGFSDDEIELLVQFISICRQNNKSPGEWHRFYNSCRRALWEANKTLWPRRKARITLYSARHAFSSRAKKSLSTRETAAVMGHKSEETAQIHYGRRTSHADGGAMSVPRPIGEAISFVVSTKEPRMPSTSPEKAGSTKHVE